MYRHIIILYMIKNGKEIGMLYRNPSAMEPLFPSGAPELEDLAREVISQSAALGGQLHTVTQQTVVELLRLINSYYSNLIEGHSAHPVDIERAMDQDYSSDPGKRDFQTDSLAHITCQRDLESHLQQNSDINIADTFFLCWLPSPIDVDSSFSRRKWTRCPTLHGRLFSPFAHTWLWTLEYQPWFRPIPG